LAISGLHIGLVAGSVYYFFLLADLGRRKSILASLIIMGAYILIGGCGIPVRRAGWMVGLAMFSLLAERDRHPLNWFFLVVFGFILSDPQCLFQISFQLSFLAVLILILFWPRRTDQALWKILFGRSLLVTLGLAPLIMKYFHLFAPVGVLANVLAIPLFHLSLLTAMASLAFYGLPFLDGGLARIAGFWLEAGLEWIRTLAHLPFAYFYVPAPSILGLNAYYLWGAGWAWLRYVKFPPVLRFGWAGWLAGGLLFILLFIPPDRPAFSLRFFGEGRQPWVHVRFKDQDWIIALGAGNASRTLRKHLLPYLRAQGTGRPHGLLITDNQWNPNGKEGLKIFYDKGYMLYPAKSYFESFLDDLSHGGVRKAYSVVPGDSVEISSHGSLHVLEWQKGDLMLLIRYQDFRFLILPRLNTEILEKLDKQGPCVRFPDLVILAETRQQDPGLMRDFLEAIHPKVMVLPKKPETQMNAENTGTNWYFLDQDGSPEFFTDQNRLWLSSYASGGLLDLSQAYTY